MSRFLTILILSTSMFLLVSASMDIRDGAVDLALKKSTEKLTNDLLEMSEQSFLEVRFVSAPEQFDLLLEKALNLDSNNSDHLYHLANALLMSSYLQLDQEEADARLKLAYDKIVRSILLRPTYPDSYALKAYIERDLEMPYSEMFDSLNNAYRYGPYENNTMIVSTELYLTHWDKTTTEQKLLVSNFILEPSLYGLTLKDRDNLLLNIDEKSRACGLIKLYQGETKVC